MNILNKLRMVNSLQNALARQSDTTLVLVRGRIVVVLPVSAGGICSTIQECPKVLAKGFLPRTAPLARGQSGGYGLTR